MKNGGQKNRETGFRMHFIRTQHIKVYPDPGLEGAVAEVNQRNNVLDLP